MREFWVHMYGTGFGAAWPTRDEAISNRAGSCTALIHIKLKKGIRSLHDLRFIMTQTWY